VGSPHGLGVHDGPLTTLRIAQDHAADALLDESPLALLLGMALDQDMREGCTGR
jgi:hypothetical protein